MCESIDKKLSKLTKKELVALCEHHIRETEMYRLRCTAAIEDSDKANQEAIDLQVKLDKAEAYIEQGRAMVNAVMERWYHYDV